MHVKKALFVITSLTIILLIIGLYISQEPRGSDFANENTRERPRKTSEQLITKETYTSVFFQNTEAGRKITAYLVCIDFDCVEKLDHVVTIGEDAVFPLIYLLQYGPPPEVPEFKNGVSLVRVAIALGKLGDVRAVDSLVKLLQNLDPVVRANAAAALGEIGNSTALKDLLPLLQDSDQLVREMTAKAIGNIKLPEALPALRNAIASEPMPHVRRVMEEAIKNIE